MSKKVIYAQLHNGFFIPGMPKGGNFKATLPPTDKSLPQFNMELQDSGNLRVEWIEGDYLKGFEIGAASIIVCQFAPEKAKLNDKKVKE